MGYYTHYSLGAYNDFEGANKECSFVSHKVEVEIMKDLCEISDIWDKDDVANWGDPLDMVSDDIYKWYDHESDMLNLSRNFPEIWFVLEGYGEEGNDIWRDLYHNGQVERQYIDMRFPKFNGNAWR